MIIFLNIQKALQYSEVFLINYLIFLEIPKKKKITFSQHSLKLGNILDGLTQKRGWERAKV